MGRLLSREGFREICAGAALLCCALALICWPKEISAAVRSGLGLCYNVIIPSLFPFFILSSLVISLGLAGYLGRLLEPVMRPLFHVSGSCAAALALGFIGGYPVGARSALTLYESGQCTKTEAERLLAFCNNSGPAFIFGVVGAGVFGSGALGLLLYLVHMAASLLVGLLFRFYRPGEGPRRGRLQGAQFQTASFPAAFTHSVTGALSSTLNICAFVLFFTVTIRMLSLTGVLTGLARLLSLLFGPLGFDQSWARRLLTGVLEVSSGVSSLTGGSLSGRLSMAAFMLGWAGLSVHCQVLAFLGDSGLSMRTYLAGKLLHGGLSAALLRLLVPLLPLEAPVSAYLAEQTETLAALDFQQALTISTASAWGTWLLLFALALRVVKKSSGKKQLRGV